VCFIGPWIARLCGIPVPSKFWTKNWQNRHLPRLQFVWAFGVLIFGVGMFRFSLGSDIARRVLLEKRLSAKLFDLGFALAFSIFMGIVVAFWCAPTQAGESPVIELGLSGDSSLGSMHR
jgi:pheromone shutdown protein TraB